MAKENYYRRITSRLMLLRCVPLPNSAPQTCLHQYGNLQPVVLGSWKLKLLRATSPISNLPYVFHNMAMWESPPTILAVQDADFVMLWIISHNSDQTMLVFSPYHSDFFTIHDGRNLHRIESTESAALDNQRSKLSWVVAHTIKFAIDNDLLADK